MGAQIENCGRHLRALSEKAEQPFHTHREAALALLTGRNKLSRKAGQFLGQLAVDPSPMSKAQEEWMAKLLERAGLPPLAKPSAA
jgi:hypothetical protein